MDGILALVADAFLAAGAIGAALYCWILSRRLARLNNLEDGVGGAVASLARQVDEMTSALGDAHDAANASTHSLSELTDRADGVARRLELLVASMHDLPAAQKPLEPVGTPPEAAAFASKRNPPQEAAE
ncbi:MAG: hypothetical protein HRU32_09190 [Rhodobacteraceae bacterium]|nr:hypothetical protein [Paracoccaceae bacterium]